MLRITPRFLLVPSLIFFVAAEKPAETELHGYLQLRPPAEWKRTVKGQYLRFEPAGSSKEKMCALVINSPAETKQRLEECVESWFTDYVGAPVKPFRPDFKGVAGGGRRASITTTTKHREGRPDLTATFVMYEIDGVVQCVTALSNDAAFWKENTAAIDQFFAAATVERDAVGEFKAKGKK